MMPRTHTPRTLIGVALLCGLTATPTLGTPGAQTPIASEQIGGTILSITPQVAYESAVLRVSGPGGYALTKRLPTGTPISADLLTEAEAREHSARQDRIALPDGRYRYEVVFTDAVGESRTHTGQFFVEAGAALGRLEKQTALREIRSDLTARAFEPWMTSGQAQVGGEGTFADDFVAVVDADGNGITNVGLHIDYPSGAAEWLLVNYRGDVRFRQYYGVGNGDRMVILDGGQVGIATSVPLQELHIYSPDGADIRLSGSGGDWVWGIDSATAALAAYDATTSSSVFRLAQGAPGDSLVIHADGRVSIGTVSQAADLDVQGDVRGTTFRSASSRELKTAFEAVDPAQILARLSELPVTSWRYRDDDEEATHIGPVAEDFQRLFGLGDGETISNVDVNGVTLAAIQALLDRVECQDTVILEKDKAIEDLNSRLALIERKTASLSPSN